MKLTITDIAKMTGLAKSTVSAIINNKPGVSEATKKRVLAVIEQVNYIPNEMARGLSSKTSATIGVIVRDITNPFYGKIFRAIEKIANELNFSVLLSNSDGLYDQEIRAIKSMIGKRVDGIIIDLSENSIDGIMELKKSKIPYVVIGAHESNLMADSVEANDYLGAYQAVEHLVGCGHKKIGFVSGNKDSIYSQRRLNGIKDAFLKHQIVYNELYILKHAKNHEDGYLMGQRLLEMADRPTAIIAYNDLVAIGIIKAFTEMQCSIPEDLSIIGFDDIDILTFPLTTVSIPEYEMGMKAIELLIQRIQGNEAKDFTNIVLETKLVIRKSVKSLASVEFNA